MINFYKELNFNFQQENEITSWLKFVVEKENYNLGEITYIFCDDKYLLKINNKYLKHNTLTDIISFDYTVSNLISGDIFISIERVTENAEELKIPLVDELHRVMVHGILHYCGYKDKTAAEKHQMRSKEDYYLSLRTF